MKILMLLTGTFPTDSRVEKEAHSLSEAGHDVHLLCYASKAQPLIEKYACFTIHRLQLNFFFKNKLSALALILPIFFIIWKKKIHKLYRTYNFDAIHVHDLPLSTVGYYFKKKFGTKLICDQHEFYSNWIKETAHMNTAIGKVVSSFSNWGKYEKKYLNLADLVITVAKPLESNYIKQYNIPENKIITIPNTPSKHVYNFNNIKQEIIDKYKNYFVIFYAGGIDVLRGIDTAIIALEILKESIPNVKLILCGKIIKPYDPFKTAKRYGVTNFIDFQGWVNEDELPSYIAASNACFFTPPTNREEINKTIATKIYQYVAMQKPVIVSDAKMMKTFVKKNKFGIAIQNGNSKEFANAVLMIRSNNLIKTNNINLKDCYWEDTVEKLCSSYNKL